MGAAFIRYEDESELRTWTASELIAELANYMIEHRLSGLDYHEQCKKEEIASEIDRRLPISPNDQKRLFLDQAEQAGFKVPT